MAAKIDMTDYMSSMRKTNIRFGQSYANFNDTLQYYNLSRLPDYENATEPYIAHILMSRPMLNISDQIVRSTDSEYDDFAFTNYAQLRQNAMTAAFMNDKYGKQLMMSLSAYSSNPWMPIITTRAKTFNVGDIELKTVEKGNTYYGHVLKYGKHSEDHKVSGSLSIDFRNDRYLSVLKLMYLWMCYIYLVSKTDIIKPTTSNQVNAILDYPASIYYLVTRRDARELVYWEKVVGVFPTRTPMSIFSFNDSMIMEDSISIDFSYGIKSDPCDPSVLMDINMLSNQNYNKIVANTMHGDTYLMHGATEDQRKANAVYHANRRTLYNGEWPMVQGDVFAKYPFIRVSKVNGNLKYYLTWEG